MPFLQNTHKLAIPACGRDYRNIIPSCILKNRNECVFNIYLGCNFYVTCTCGDRYKEHVVFLMHCLIFGLIGLVYHAGATGIMALNGAEMTWLQNPLTNSLLGVLLGGAIMLLYFGVSYVMAGGRMAMGDGDIYIAMALGACFGWEKIWIIIIMGF